MLSVKRAKVLVTTAAMLTAMFVFERFNIKMQHKLTALMPSEGFRMLIGCTGKVMFCHGTKRIGTFLWASRNKNEYLEFSFL
jgi:hypothetical protein